MGEIQKPTLTEVQIIIDVSDCRLCSHNIPEVRQLSWNNTKPGIRKLGSTFLTILLCDPEQATSSLWRSLPYFFPSLLFAAKTTWCFNRVKTLVIVLDLASLWVLLGIICVLTSACMSTCHRQELALLCREVWADVPCTHTTSRSKPLFVISKFIRSAK